MASDTDQTINAPGVLLTGASSQIGVFIIPRLLRSGFRIVAVSRVGRPESYPELDNVEWLTEADATQAAQKFEYFISAGPLALTEKFLKTNTNLKTVIAFSSSSVETKQASENLSERSQMQTMLGIETSLQQLAVTKCLKLLILRPTLIYGCGLDTNISRLAVWIKRRFGFMPVNGKATGLRQPVHADDLASAAVSAMLSTGTLPTVMILTGGETLSYSVMVERVFTAMDKPVRLLRLPQWLFVLLIKTAGIFKSGRDVNSEMVKRQKLDMIFEDKSARQLLNYDPRSFSPDKGDFVFPDIGK